MLSLDLEYNTTHAFTLTMWDHTSQTEKDNALNFLYARMWTKQVTQMTSRMEKAI